MKTEKYLSYRHFLTAELEARVRANPNYTVAEFCQELNMRHSRLSEILSGKLGLSEEKAVDIAERLKLSEDDKKIFVDLVQSLHGRGALVRKIAEDRLRQRFGEETSVEASLSAISLTFHKSRLPWLLEMLEKIARELKSEVAGDDATYRFKARIYEVPGKK